MKKKARGNKDRRGEGKEIKERRRETRGDQQRQEEGEETRKREVERKRQEGKR